MRRGGGSVAAGDACCHLPTEPNGAGSQSWGLRHSRDPPRPKAKLRCGQRRRPRPLNSLPPGYLFCRAFMLSALRMACKMTIIGDSSSKSMSYLFTFPKLLATLFPFAESLCPFAFLTLTRVFLGIFKAVGSRPRDESLEAHGLQATDQRTNRHLTGTFASDTVSRDFHT